MQEKILIVVDEKEIRSLLSKSLTRFGGFQIDVVEDGEETLKKVETDDLFDKKVTQYQLIRKYRSFHGGISSR